MNSVDEINSRKEEIAFCIARTIANNSNLDFKEIFELIKKQVNSADVVISLAKPFESSYDKKIKKLTSELNELVFFDVTPYLNNKIKVEYRNDNNDEIIKKYNRNASMYTKVGITLDRYKNLYSFYDEEKMKVINFKIKKLIKKTYLSNFKRSLSSFSDSLNYKSAIKSSTKVFDEYNVKSIKDLIDFRNELLSFTINLNNYNEEDKKIILDNRKKLCERVNKEDFFISNVDAEKMISKIDNIFNLEAFGVVFSKDVWKNIIDKIGVSSKNINGVIATYSSLMNVTALCSTYLDKNNDPITYCIFSEKLFYFSKSVMNRIIIHEFIHSVDAHNSDNKKSFSSKYPQINEAITEYFAIEATNYLSSDILSINAGDRISGGSVYASMLSLIDILKNSEIWEDILKAKLNDDVVKLEEKVGISNMSKIKSCFIGNLLSMQDLDNTKLIKILNGIENIKK